LLQKRTSLKGILRDWIFGSESRNVGSSFSNKKSRPDSNLKRKLNFGDTSISSTTNFLDSPSKTRVPFESAIIIGGWQGTEEDKTNNIHEYGPCRNCTIVKQDGSNTSWKRTKYVTKQPVCYSGTCFLEPYVYIIGGYDGNQQNNGGINNCYKFDVNLCAWSEIAPLKQERLYLVCCSYSEKNCIFAIGGGTKALPRIANDSLDDENSIWEAHERAWYLEQQYNEGRDYMNRKGKLKLVEKYDISTNEWTRLPNMRDYRSDCSAIISKDKLFVAGGFDGITCLKSIEYYDFKYNNHWVKLKDMTLPRSGLGLVHYDNSLVVIGGYAGNNGVRHDSCEMLKCFVEESKKKKYTGMQTRKRYSLRGLESIKENEDWKVLPSKLNLGRSNFGACVVKGYFLGVLLKWSMIFCHL